MAPLAVWTAVAMLAAPSVEAAGDIASTARAIEHMLIAPCCFTQQVSVHQSPAAEAVREEVRARLAAGESQQQILDAFVARYGTQVLAQPPAVGFNRTLYVVPLVVFVASLALVALMIRRFTAASNSAGGGGLLSDGAQRIDDARLDDALRDLD